MKQLPKTPEQMEARRLYQIEYRKKNPIPKLTAEQKKRKSEYGKLYRLKLKEDKEAFKRARIEKREQQKLDRITLLAERKEARRIANNAKRKPTKAELGIEAKPRGRKPTITKPARTPQKHKHIMRPMQKIREKERILPTIKHDLSQKIKLHIPELRLDVFIDPTQDIEAVRAKYLKR